MPKAKGLGKGLDALMGDSTTLQSQEAGSVMLPISQVEPGLNQPRKRFDEAALADLAASIQEHGIIQPLTVRRLSTGYYQIIAGERRWRAAKLAGRRDVTSLFSFFPSLLLFFLLFLCLLASPGSLEFSAEKESV